MKQRDTPSTQAQGCARPPQVAESRAKTTLFARDGAGPGRMPGSSASSPEQRPITALRGVGDALAERLGRLGVAQVQDLLFVLPLRYEDRTTVVRIGSAASRDARGGGRRDPAGGGRLPPAAAAAVQPVATAPGFLTLRFFHFSGSQQQGLARGTRLRCFGEIRRGPQGSGDRASGVSPRERCGSTAGGDPDARSIR